MIRFFSIMVVIIGIMAQTGNTTELLTQTPFSYDDLTIAALRERSYGGGAIQIREVLTTNASFTRYLISYPSDGITIYGFMNVPTGTGPFPVIIAIHGYVDPLAYSTLDYTTRYADSLVQAGFLVLHPNLRDYFPSDPDNTEGLFRVSYAVDILNLIALIKETGGQPGVLQSADPDHIGLWGHSMGGGIALRVLTVNRDVNAAVLYGSMSGNEQKNYEKIVEWSGGDFGFRELGTPPEILVNISPIYHLEWMETPVSVHHGLNDESVPYEWSVELCNELFVLDKPFECFFYDGQPHTFYGEGDRLFIERSITFFDAHLRGN